jgi:hypothetical protein
MCSVSLFSTDPDDALQFVFILLLFEIARAISAIRFRGTQEFADGRHAVTSRTRIAGIPDGPPHERLPPRHDEKLSPIDPLLEGDECDF